MSLNLRLSIGGSRLLEEARMQQSANRLADVERRRLARVQQAAARRQEGLTAAERDRQRQGMSLTQLTQQVPVIPPRGVLDRDLAKKRPAATATTGNPLFLVTGKILSTADDQLTINAEIRSYLAGRLPQTRQEALRALRLTSAPATTNQLADAVQSVPAIGSVAPLTVTGLGTASWQSENIFVPFSGATIVYYKFFEVFSGSNFGFLVTASTLSYYRSPFEGRERTVFLQAWKAYPTQLSAYNQQIFIAPSAPELIEQQVDFKVVDPQGLMDYSNPPVIWTDPGDLYEAMSFSIAGVTQSLNRSDIDGPDPPVDIIQGTGYQGSMDRAWFRLFHCDRRTGVVTPISHVLDIPSL
jgi:hypothetical protein